MNDQNIEPKESSSEFNLQKIMGLLLQHWPWLVGSVVIALILANINLRYQTPLYHIRAKLLIQDGRSTSGVSEADFLKDLGLGGKSNVDNEVEIFKSRHLMQEVVKDLQLNVQYFTRGRFKNLEAYEPKPFTFTILPASKDTFYEKYAGYELGMMNDSTYVLFDGTKYWKGKWGTVLNLAIGRVLVDRNNTIDWPSKQKYLIVVSDVDAIAGNFLGALDVSLLSNKVSMINLVLTDAIQQRGEVVLNKLVDVYIKANVDDKNRIADSTMSFIDERLKVVGDELRGVEKNIEEFKQAQNFNNIGAESQMLMQSSNNYLDQLTEKEVQLNVVESIEKYIVDNNRRVIPANMAMQNPTFTGLIDKYNALQMERERALMTTTENNPLIISMNNQLDNLRADVKNNLASAKNNIQISISQLRNKAGNISAQMRAVPAKERVFIDISRQQNIKQELYLFLLKKREECAITKSSTIANARVIDQARSDGWTFSPNRSKAYMNAFLIGLLLPIIGIYLKEQLNTKVSKRSDITLRTTTPLLAEIGHNSEAKNILVDAGSKSVISEQFRNLRTNLQFLLPDPSQKIILLTSTMSGEGKSFIASNLATSLAITNKKVLLMELDLRKPKISKMFNLNSPLGFSSYIIGQSELKDAIVPSKVHDSLFVMPSGPLPPNPAELLMMAKTKEMFGVLRNHFDYIIVDTAPVGLVTDAQITGANADATIYVVRQDYTFKQQIELVNDMYKNKKLPSMSIVVNDVKASKSAYGYGYGYGYGYSYGYGYGDYSNGYFDGSDHQRKGWRRTFHKIRRKIGV